MSNQRCICTDKGTKPSMYHFLMFLLMMLLWVLMSGKFDMFHLSLGAISSIIVASLSSDLLFQGKSSLSRRLSEGFRFIGYAIWLVWQITLANLHVIYLALSTKPIKETLDPQIFTFRTMLQTEFARFVLANSITLTPGTVTIRVKNDTFYIHAISEKAMGDLAECESFNEMEKRVAAVFEPELLRQGKAA